jgi:hypothetical protein
VRGYLMAGSLTGGPVEDGAGRSNDAYIAALLRERDGYVARGLGDRVSAVEAELVRAGVELVEWATAEPEAERAVIPKARRK